MGFESHRPLLRKPAIRIVFAAALILPAIPTSTADAALRTWSKSQGDIRITLEAELLEFDFAEKEMRCRDRQGAELRLSTADLDTKSRLQLLLSRKFIQSFPEKGFSREQGYFILLAVAVPAVFLLISFFLSALILTKSLNPFRALIGWGGSVVLGAFLVSFYVILCARAPDSASGIAVFGTIVVSGLLSLYVSIVYRITILKGFKLLLLHVFGAAILFVAAIGVVRLFLSPGRAAGILERIVFQPTGLV